MNKEEKYLEALQIISNMRPHKLSGKECKEIAKKAISDEPLVQADEPSKGYDEVVTIGVSDSDKEDTKINKNFIRYDRNPQNTRSLMKGLVRICPQIYEHWDEAFALIKTYIHLEKYIAWSMVYAFSSEDEFVNKMAMDKMATHNKDGWRDFDKNLKWVKEYQDKDVRVNINGKIAYLRGDRKKSTYQEVVEKAFDKEFDGTVYSIAYKNKDTKSEGILSFDQTIEVDQDTSFIVAHTGNA